MGALNFILTINRSLLWAKLFCPENSVSDGTSDSLDSVPHRKPWAGTHLVRTPTQMAGRWWLLSSASVRSLAQCCEFQVQSQRPLSTESASTVCSQKPGGRRQAGLGPSWLQKSNEVELHIY